MQYRFSVANHTHGQHFTQEQQTSLVKKKKGRSITILGDSIIKDIRPHKFKKDLKNKESLFVKSFSGATTVCMGDYVKPSLKYKPDLLILHTGANDLRGTKTPSEIANGILDLANQIKTTENEVMVSSITPRDDNLHNKGLQVNEFLKTRCSENNIYFIDNSNISKFHLNGSGVHLNPQGTFTLANNFLSNINY